MAQPLVLREKLPGATATTGRKMSQIWTPMVALIVLAFLTLVPASTTALAQSLDGGSLGGSVIDAFGGLVVGARVEARNDSTSIIRWSRTDQEGKYRIAELAPGTYHVQITGPGFAPADSICTVQLGRMTELNISLYVGGPHEAITASKGIPKRLDATSSSIATNIRPGVRGLAAFEWPTLVRLCPAHARRCAGPGWQWSRQRSRHESPDEQQRHRWCR